MADSSLKKILLSLAACRTIWFICLEFMAYAACSALRYKKVQPGNRQESACSPQMQSGSAFQRKERLSIPRATHELSRKTQAGVSQVTWKWHCTEGSQKHAKTFLRSSRETLSMQETVTFPWAGAQLCVRQPRTCITWAQTSQEPAVVKNADKSHGRPVRKRQNFRHRLDWWDRDRLQFKREKHWCEQL